MKKLFFIITMTSVLLFAKPCMIDIYTGNGINTTDGEAWANMDELEYFMLNKASASSKLDASKYNVDYSFNYIHNPSYGFVDDILETFYGLKETGQISDGYFSFILAIATGNLTIDEATEKYRQIVSTYEGDVSSIYSQYVTSSFSKKHNVLLVAHSQGNIIGNKIFTKLTSSQIKKFRMVSVATPANSVAGGGPYVTVHGDGVIQPVPGALASNVAGTGHNFITTYLDAHSNARNLIAQHVKSAYDSFMQTTSCVEYAFVRVIMPSFGQIKIIGKELRKAEKIIGSTSLPIRDAYYDDIQKRWECGEPDTGYTTENGWGTNWALFNLYKITGGSYSFNRMEWLPGRLHNQNELDSRKSISEDMIMGTKCVTMTLEEGGILYDKLYDIFLE